MNDLHVQLVHARACAQPLDSWQSMGIAGQLLAPLEVVMRAMASVLDLPVIGVAAVPALVAFPLLGTAVATVVATLLVGSALLFAGCTDLAAVLARATLVLGIVRDLGGA